MQCNVQVVLCILHIYIKVQVCNQRLLSFEIAMHWCQEIWYLAFSISLVKMFLLLMSSYKEPLHTKLQNKNVLIPLNPIQSPFSLPSYTRYAFNCIKQSMLLLWVLDICLQEQTVHLWEYEVEISTIRHKL